MVMYDTWIVKKKLMFKGEIKTEVPQVTQQLENSREE